MMAGDAAARGKAGRPAMAVENDDGRHLPRAINDLSRDNAAVMGELREAVERVLASGWFVMGPEVTAFEREFAAYCGVEHCVGLANGTEALELCLRALGVRPGARVVTVANAGMYASCAIRALGATPQFADVDDESMLMDPESLRSLDLDGCDAIIATHLFGRLAPMAQIRAIADARGIPVVEDCAQAHGARAHGRTAGSFGAAACFSFYPTKNLGALGDAGAVVTGDGRLAAEVRRLRQYGWGTKYHAEVSGGRNSRLDELQAALLRVKLRHVDAWNERRREIARRYCAGIVHPDVRLPAGPIDEACVAHLFVVRARERDALAAHLRARSVPVDVHYPVPDHRQPAMAGPGTPVRLPVSEAACASVLTLPCFPAMRNDEVDAIVAAVNAWTPAR